MSSRRLISGTPQLDAGGGTIDLMELLPRERREIAPGAVHLPDWLSVDEQLSLVRSCERWAEPPGGAFAAKVRSGYMSVQTVCLGWHWLPYRYSRYVENGDRTRVKPFPEELRTIGRAAVAAAYGPEEANKYEPDAALSNFYDVNAKMGMHQDKDERAPAPVVSISLGNRAVFRFGNPQRRTKPYVDVELHSGDVFVFGKESRLAFHGITKTYANTASPDLAMPTNGRWNITIRKTGLPPEL